MSLQQFPFCISFALHSSHLTIQMVGSHHLVSGLYLKFTITAKKLMPFSQLASLIALRYDSVHHPHHLYKQGSSITF